MSIWKYAALLPPVPGAHHFSLGEGQTPLVRSRRLGPRLGLPNLYFKLESANPSGSYKDRFAALAISDMLQHGKAHCVATSSGNTGAALAAYCAAAGIACEIAVLETTPDGKLQQMLAYGAKVYRVRGFGMDAAATAAVMEGLREKASRGTSQLQISAFAFCPIGMAGVETIAFELVEQAPGGAPWDHVFCPAGGGGLTLAVAQGFWKTMSEAGPKIECVQPEGNDTMAGPLSRGEACARAVQGTSTISGLQVASVIDGDAVIAACRRSGGTGHTVSDQQVWEAQKLLAREEGLFCEPAGAVALAGLLRARLDESFKPQSRIVCLVTGSGFKDTASLARLNEGMACPTLSAEEALA